MKASIAVVFSFLFTLGLRSADKVEKPNSTYVRFHIDSVPASGKLNLRASFQLHHGPWGASTNFGEKAVSAKSHDFTKIGKAADSQTLILQLALHRPAYRKLILECFTNLGVPT